MLYLVGDKNGEVFESVLNYKKIKYLSFLGKVFPESIKLEINDKIIFIGTKEQLKLYQEKYGTSVIFLSRNHINEAKILEIVDSVNTDDIILDKNINIDSISTINIGGEEITIIDDNEIIKDNRTQIKRSELASAFNLISKFDNVSSCKIRIKR